MSKKNDFAKLKNSSMSCAPTTPVFAHGSTDSWKTKMPRHDDIAYLDTMNEVLEMTAQFVEEARVSEDDVRLGVYLRMASRCMRCALEMYEEHLAQNRAEMEQGETKCKSTK